MNTTNQKWAAWNAFILIAACWMLSAHSALLGADGSGLVNQVVVVFKTHFDIGYTDMASNVLSRYRTTMARDALKVVESNKDLPSHLQFVWTLPGWPLTQIIKEGPDQAPEQREHILASIQNGRFAMHALPFTTHTELLESEDLVRGLGYASQLSRQAGLALPRDAKMTDVPCHSWILPTLLRHAGVDFLHLGCNAASRSPEVPPLFWWEGPDGSRLLTMYTAESYGTDLVPPKNWHHKTWLALIHTGDNHGPPTPAEVQQLFKEAAEKLPGVRIKIGRLSDFSDALLAEKSELPVVKGDMPDTWIHGPMCDPAGAKIARNIRPMIHMADTLNTLSKAWKAPQFEADRVVAKAYEKSLLYGEHTWGGALYWVSKYDDGRRLEYGDAWKERHAAGRYQKLEDSWAEHTSYIESARDLISPLFTSQMQALAANVSVSGNRIVVYNPLPWARSGLVTFQSQKRGILAAQPVNGTEPIPIESVDGNCSFVAKNIPAMGYRTFKLVENSSQSVGSTIPAIHVIESPFFRVVIDPKSGAISSLVDRRTGREWADSSASPQIGQHLYERFSAKETQSFVDAYVKIKASWASNELGKPNMPSATVKPYEAHYPENVRVAFRSSALSTVAHIRSNSKGRVPYEISTKIVLYNDQPIIDLEMTVENKPADPWPEAGWLCLPFKIDNPRFLLGRLGSIIDPTKDIVPGANHYMMALNSGMAVLDDKGQGIGICPLDSPLVSLDEPGCWKYARQFIPKKAAVYVNLFNNQWTTNFRLWNQGTWKSRVRLWIINATDPRGSLISHSLEARYPLQAVVSDGKGGTMPASQTGLEISSANVMVNAFGSNPDGEGTILRLWEMAGKSSQCTIKLPTGLGATKVLKINLRGEPLGTEIPIEKGTLKVDIGPFAPVTILFK
jgi:hypothetical protein